MTTPEPRATTDDLPPTPSESSPGSGASPSTTDGTPPSFAEAEAKAVEELAELLELDTLPDQVAALRDQVAVLERALELAPATRSYLKAVRR